MYVKTQKSLGSQNNSGKKQNNNIWPLPKQNKTKTNAGGIPELKINYRALVTTAAKYCHKNRHGKQWDKIEDPNMST